MRVPPEQLLTGCSMLRVCDILIQSSAWIDPWPHSDTHRLLHLRWKPHDIIPKHLPILHRALHEHSMRSRTCTIAIGADACGALLHRVLEPFGSRLRFRILFLRADADCVTDELQRRVEQHPSVDFILAHHLVERTIKTYPLPLGVANYRGSIPHWAEKPHAHCNADKMKHADQPIYVNFAVHCEQRLRAQRQLASNGFFPLPTRSYDAYMRELASYQFCASPDGKAKDCFRTWEALASDCVPIADDWPVMRRAFPSLPVLWVGRDGHVPSWQHVTAAFLASEPAQQVLRALRTHAHEEWTIDFWIRQFHILCRCHAPPAGVRTAALVVTPLLRGTLGEQMWTMARAFHVARRANGQVVFYASHAPPDRAVERLFPDVPRRDQLMPHAAVVESDDGNDRGALPHVVVQARAPTGAVAPCMAEWSVPDDARMHDCAFIEVPRVWSPIWSVYFHRCIAALRARTARVLLVLPTPAEDSAAPIRSMCDTYGIDRCLATHCDDASSIASCAVGGVLCTRASLCWWAGWAGVRRRPGFALFAPSSMDRADMSATAVPEW
jgi:hypothetical protein